MVKCKGIVSLAMPCYNGAVTFGTTVKLNTLYQKPVEALVVYREILNLDILSTLDISNSDSSKYPRAVKNMVSIFCLLLFPFQLLLSETNVVSK